jgi:phosphatidylinositol transfer protein SFH5
VKPAEDKPAEEKPAEDKAAAETKEEEKAPAKSTLDQLLEKLEALIEETGHNEVWGISLAAPVSVPGRVVLQKFLRANKNSVDGAVTQLRKTLAWRKEFKPLDAVAEVFSKEKFNDLGYIVEIPADKSPTKEREVCTFNLYGVVKDYEKTFGDLEAFMRWRVALMELTVQKYGIDKAEEVIPEFGKGPDPYQGNQVSLSMIMANGEGWT